MGVRAGAVAWRRGALLEAEEAARRGSPGMLFRSRVLWRGEERRRFETDDAFRGRYRRANLEVGGEEGAEQMVGVGGEGRAGERGGGMVGGLVEMRFGSEEEMSVGGEDERVERGEEFWKLL